MKRRLLVVLMVLVVYAGFAFAGEKARDGRFIAYENGTILDTRTNLMWAERDNGSIVNWAEAEYYCESYRGGGYTDWRMPTRDELAELYDGTKTYKSDCGDGNDVHLTGLIRLRCGWVWASETRGIQAAYFLFYDGKRRWYPQADVSYNFRALPVRSVKSGDLVLPRPVGMESSSDIIEYKDGEDGVMRTRPGNHKPGEKSPARPEYKDGEDGTMRARPPE